MLWRRAEARCGISSWKSGRGAWPGREGIAMRVLPWFLSCSFLPLFAISDGSMGRREIPLYACAVRRQLVLELDFLWRKKRKNFGIVRINEVSTWLRHETCVAPTALGLFDILRTQGFHPGLGVCRAYGAGAHLNECGVWRVLCQRAKARAGCRRREKAMGKRRC